MRRRTWRWAASCRSRGDQLGARNWIEKSLIAAPDYKAAQRQLALLAHECASARANLVSFGAMKPQGTQLSLFETRSSSDPFAVRVSPRARRLTARVHVGGRVEIVVPVGVNAHAVRDFVHRFTPWIDRKVAAMQCMSAPSEPVPRVIEFAFTGERFGVRMAPRRRREGSSSTATASSVQAPDEPAARGLLQGWLKRAAEERLAPRLLRIGGDLKYSGLAGQHPLSAHALGQLLDARHRELELLPGISAGRRWCAICSSTSWRIPST